MKNRRQLFFRAGALLVIAAVAAAMFVIGRGHTVYFDNRAIEVNGETLPAYYKVVVKVNGEKVASLSEKDRGMTDTMGQTFSMDLEITKEKGAAAEISRVTMPLPYALDGVVVNIPALMAGNGQDVYMEEFIPLPSATEEETDEVPEGEIGIEDLENMGDDF